MEYAVISFKNNQYMVKPGDKIESLGIKGEVGDIITDVEVLFEKDGDAIKIGTPNLDRSISLKVASIEKTDKVDIFKYRAKSRYRRHTGHRQPMTVLEVVSASGAVKAAPKAKVTPKAVAPAKKSQKTAAK